MRYSMKDFLTTKVAKDEDRTTSILPSCSSCASWANSCFWLRFRLTTLYKSKPLQIFAGSFAKISQRIYRAAVHHVAQFRESLIGRQISVNNHSSNVFRILNGRR